MSPTGRRAVLLAIGVAAGCAPPEPELQSPDVPQMQPRATPMADEPGSLATVVAVPVEGRTGPGGEPFEVAARTGVHFAGHARRFGLRTLDTAFRDVVLEAYPCTSCHIAGRPGVPGPERVADAHGNILPLHPQETGATCGTCHSPARVDRLSLGTGETVTLDHPYRLCAQCHAPQVEAWAGGAHGKRLDGWHGRRVVMNCTDCHDPHRPALETRMPFPGPRLP
jgi:hypothetical protein